jgi:type IV secretion system protein VirB2
MNVLLTPVLRRGIAHGQHLRWTRSILCLVTLLIVLPALAEAQFINSPFDTGLTSLQSLFTGTVAKVASLIAIVIGGYQFAHGEPGAKKVAASAARRSPRRLLS